MSNGERELCGQYHVDSPKNKRAVITLQKIGHGIEDVLACLEAWWWTEQLDAAYLCGHVRNMLLHVDVLLDCWRCASDEGDQSDTQRLADGI